jgi:GGDEF domain-containing protein
MAGQSNDDPRKLSALITRVSDLALAHSVSSVVVGLVAEEGDLVFPEYVNFLQSSLRVEDGIFRMTRERAVLHLVDIDASRATEVLGRLTGDFCDEFPALRSPDYQLRMLEVKPGAEKLRVKDVLTEIFSPRVLH